MQPRLYSHQPDFTVGVIADAHNAEFGRGLPHEFVYVGVGWHTKTLTQPFNRIRVAAPYRNQFYFIWQGLDERTV